MLDEFVTTLKEAMPESPWCCGILDDDDNVVAVHFAEAIVWQMENEERMVVEKDFIDDFEISTIFSTMDLNGNTLKRHFNVDGIPHRELKELERFAKLANRPVCHFETMIFSPKTSSTWDRYQTMDEAKQGHEKAIEHTKANQ